MSSTAIVIFESIDVRNTWTRFKSTEGHRVSHPKISKQHVTLILDNDNEERAARNDAIDFQEFVAVRKDGNFFQRYYDLENCTIIRIEA